MRSFLLSFTLLAALVAAASAQAQGAISGTVTDELGGESISSVQVLIDALGLETLADEDGRYRLQNVPEGRHRLTARQIGYASVSVMVTVTSGETVVQDFSLSQQVVALDALVVTGVPGETRVRAIGNSLERLDTQAVTEQAPVVSVQQVLEGRTAGVNMMGSAMVGAAPRMRIRGSSTFSLSGNPLLYIDGVRADSRETTGYGGGNNNGVRSALSSLDPEQIERIEVLKGPAAATLYGTEASRGVINVITKRGAAGATRLDVMVRQGFNWTQGPADRIGYENYWRNPAGEVSSLNVVDHWSAQGRDIFTTGQIQSYAATLSGGSEDAQYFFAGTYSDEVGILDYNYSKKLNLRTNINAQLTNNLAATLSMGYTRGNDRIPIDGYRSVTEGLQFGSPRWLGENRCVERPGAGCDLFDGFISGAPPARDRSLINTQNLDRFTGGVTLNNTALGWLTNRLTLGLDYTGEVNVQLREFQTNDTTIASLGSVGSMGFRNEGRRTHVMSTVDFSTTAEFDLTEAISTATSVGIQYYTRTTSFLNAGGQQFAGPGLSTVNATAVLGVPGNNDIGDKTLGLYVQETLALNDRLFFTGAVRVDNHSAFGSDIEFVTYPKASLSWVITDEPWFGQSSLLSSLRLRGAWGKSGEQPAAFSALRTWGAVTGPQSTGGVSPNTVGNPDLTAEVGEEIEVGFDVELLNARLGLQFSYYDKRTKDAILQRDLAPSTGFTGQQFFNAGQINNQGMEAQLNATFIDGPGFRWNVFFSGSWNSAEIIQLTGQPGDTSIIFNSWSSMEHRVGYAPNSWFGVDVVSGDIDPETGRTVDAMCRAADGGTTPCFSASGSTIAPRVFLGRAIAPYQLSFGTDIDLGQRFKFHAMFTSELGHKRFDNTLRQRCRLYRLCRVNYFPEEADDVSLMAGIQSGNAIIDPWVNDVGFVRLKEVSVSYELPVSFFGVSRAVAQIAARNMLTFTNWTSSDPETMFSSGNRAFMEQNMMPLPQQITTTIRLSF